MDEQQATMGVSVDVRDIYTWRATYSENDSLDEKHAVGGFASVHLSRCTSLMLLDQAGNAIHVVDIPENATPVFFRRRRIAINVTDESSTPQGTTHCIGWKRSEEDAVYLFVFEDGSTLLSSDLQAG